ncbi:MAG: hypothetical protein AAFY88_30450, partial [Acidobacteriota bacterium]
MKIQQIWQSRLASRMPAALVMVMVLALAACGPAEPPIPALSEYQPDAEEQALLDRLTRHA